MKLKVNGEVKELTDFYDKVNTKGRPRKVINEKGLQVVELMASSFSVEEEIATVLGMSIDTLLNEDNKELFRSAIERGKAKGKQSLRKKQYELGMKGNCSMLIWLGKQYLGQSEKVEANVNDQNKQMMLDYLEGQKK